MITVFLVCWPCCLYMHASNASYIVDQLESEHHQRVTDLQIKLGDQENTLVGQKNEIKQKEAHIKQLVSTIEAKDRLLSETLMRQQSQTMIYKFFIVIMAQNQV